MSKRTDTPVDAVQTEITGTAMNGDATAAIAEELRPKDLARDLTHRFSLLGQGFIGLSVSAYAARIAVEKFKEAWDSNR